MTEEKRSEKHELARNSLPDELKPVFDDFVADYRFAGTQHHGSGPAWALLPKAYETIGALV